MMLRPVPDCIAAQAIGTEDRAAGIEQFQVSPAVVMSASVAPQPRRE